MTELATRTELIRDLADEQAELGAVLDGLGPDDWDRPTPSVGWLVRDQVDHLAFGNDTAALVLRDPARYLAGWYERSGDPLTYAEQRRTAARSMSGALLLRHWHAAAGEFIATVRAAPPGTRVPWAGNEIRDLSLVSARLMETWAHGQDIYDACGLTRRPTERLRHIARLGVRARSHSYTVNGLAVPLAAPRVELETVDGGVWSMGPEGALDLVRGPMLDFCLVVTRRRHWHDTELVAVGPEAAGWLEIAQAYVGDPGPGRAPQTARRASSSSRSASED